MAVPSDKLKALFMDLGKATKRGVRKCPQCGTINGTRGLTCKNRSCEFAFKEGSKKTVTSANAVNIVTGSSAKVFSVRLRDRGPDYRGFVQLPLVQDLDGNPAENVDPTILVSVLSSAAKCYVDSCNRSKQGVESSPMCPHIKAAIHCSDEAQPLTLKNSVLNALQVSPEVKQSIWLLATETTGPLVQRVTKNIFVVKCKPSVKHPLGFLHFAFYSVNKGKDELEFKFQCSCKQKPPKATTKVLIEETKRMCVHYYACICAFASDEELVQEFAHYIAFEKFSEILPEVMDTTIIFTQEGINEARIETSVSTHLSQMESTVTSHDELVPELDVHEEELSGVDTVLQSHTFVQDTEESIIQEGVDVADIHIHDTSLTKAEPSGVDLEDVGAADSVHRDLEQLESVVDSDTQSSSIEVVIDNHQIGAVLEPDNKRLKLTTASVTIPEHTDTLAQASSALLTLQESNSSASPPQHLISSDVPISTNITVTGAEVKLLPALPKNKHPLPRNTPKKAPPDESSLMFSFHQWLGSVTERINQTMHYQFDGNPEPLVFHAPQSFFESLQARISAGSKKKRLPNSTVGFIRKDALPLGTFTKYTWHITNILHVKQIFDSQWMSLDITRSFIENKDGTYEYYDKMKSDSNHQFSNDGKNLPIRPFELNTYLKVGHTSATQKEATPFIIEWIPDILPKSRIGELRIKFQYGHQKNGHVEQRASSAPQPQLPHL